MVQFGITRDIPPPVPFRSHTGFHDDDEDEDDGSQSTPLGNTHPHDQSGKCEFVNRREERNGHATHWSSEIRSCVVHSRIQRVISSGLKRVKVEECAMM